MRSHSMRTLQGSDFISARVFHARRVRLDRCGVKEVLRENGVKATGFEVQCKSFRVAVPLDAEGWDPEAKRTPPPTPTRTKQDSTLTEKATRVS